MSKIPIRKTMKATVLTKRTQHLRKYYRERSYKPLHTKLKNNNNYLAKALSEEKQTNQSLFQQNLALIAEIQTLNLECNKRNNVIVNILNNAKEMLKMVVTMSRYATNTITMCQDLNASNIPVRLSSGTTGRKESMRLSKSPAKGVVKPMVSGHTITKPTINLSRVNMTNFNNQILSDQRLSDIQEVVTPVRNPQINEDRSSINVSLPSTPLTYEPVRTYRMPERIAVSSPRVNGTFAMFDEPRLRRKISGSYSRSRSNRWSIDETPRNSTEHINVGFPTVKLKDISKLLKKSQPNNVDKTPRNSTEHINIGFPTVKLKDVSKLLKNSQSINIKRLFSDRVDNIEIQENSDDVPHDTSNRSVIQDTQVSVNSDEEDETYAHISKKDSVVQISSKVPDKNFDRSSNATEKSRPSQNNNRDWEEDPLEGPSWLFDNTFTIPSRDEPEEEVDHLHDSDVNNNTSQITVYDDSSDSSIEDLSMSNLSERVSDIHTSQRDAASVADRIGYRSYLINDDEAGGNFCGLAADVSSHKRNLDNTEDNVNFSSFVTMRRGHSKAMEEETEDFTLMLSHQPKRNMPFDINELRLPVVEKSMINSTINNGIDTEATAVLMNISIPSMSSQSLNKSELNRTTTKLPFILINNHERILTSEKKKNLNKKSKNAKSPSLKDEINDTKNVVGSKNKVKQRNKSENQDPNAVKVVVEKLHESHIKMRMSLTDETRSPNSTNHTNVSIIFDQEKDRRYSEDSTDSNCVALRRPKRRKAPTNLKEPNLHTKMRRNK